MINQEISINFVGGSHGHFLRHILNKMFYAPKSDLVSSGPLGTWHKSSDNSYITIGHYYWTNLSEYIHPTFLSNLPPLHTNVISICTPSVLSCAVLRSFWGRVADVCVIGPNDLVGMNVTEFTSTWNANAAKCWDQSPISIQLRKNNFEYLLHHIFVRGRADEDRIVLSWVNRSHWISRDIIANLRWSEELAKNKHAYMFELLWFYDENTALSEIKKVGEKFQLGAPNLNESDALEFLRSFKNNIPELPNLRLTEQLLAKFIDGDDFPLSGIDIHTKIALFNGIIHLNFYDIDDINLDFSVLPLSLSELRKCINKVKDNL